MSGLVLVLASQSAARRAMLEAAGVPYEALSPAVDEDSAKAALRADGIEPRGLADALAELKARRLSQRLPGALVLGCDQVLALEDGTTLDKPGDRHEAAAQLQQLRGSSHRLISAAVICENGQPVWRAVETASLTVRSFSDGFLDRYLAAEWPAIAGCVGAYRYEGLGAQLFSAVRGSHWAVLGLPLLPLLDYLRVRGVLAA
jgi:septum formation protein